MLYGIDGLACAEQSLIAIQHGSNPLRVLRLFLDSDGEIDDLAEQLQTARLLAIAGIVVGVIGLAVGAAALLMKRS